MNSKGPYCADCMAHLPRPAMWKDRDPLPSAISGERVVRNFHEALDAHFDGYRYTDLYGVTWDLYAVTYVGGTSLCHSHGVLAQTRATTVGTVTRGEA